VAAQPVAGIRTWIVSCEDLILSKLVWALDSNSELQRRDIRQLLAGAIDLDYIRKWAHNLGVSFQDGAVRRSLRIPARLCANDFDSLVSAGHPGRLRTVSLTAGLGLCSRPISGRPPR
jgi:hypothetical protein